jgi:hypothetical protein
MMRDDLGLKLEGTAFLKHHPATLFLNTYERFYGVKPPLYQTISDYCPHGVWRCRANPKSSAVYRALTASQS